MRFERLQIQSQEQEGPVQEIDLTAWGLFAPHHRTVRMDPLSAVAGVPGTSKYVL